MICRRNTDFFKKILAFLSQLKRNKESKNVTVVLHFSPKQAKCNSFRTLFGTLRCVFVLYITVFICTALHIVVSVYVFVALRCVPFCVPFLWSKSELLCSGRHNSSFIKNTKKEAAAQKCATASHNSGYAIEQCSGTGDHRAAFAASICLISSGTTLNRSPTMP